MLNERAIAAPSAWRWVAQSYLIVVDGVWLPSIAGGLERKRQKGSLVPSRSAAMIPSSESPLTTTATACAGGHVSTVGDGSMEKVAATGLWSEVETPGKASSESCSMLSASGGIDFQSTRSHHDGTRWSLYWNPGFRSTLKVGACASVPSRKPLNASPRDCATLS